MADLLSIFKEQFGLEDKNLRHEEVDPELLNNDHLHYQRNMIEKRVEELLKHPHHLPDNSSGLVAQREDGSLWVINGQHHGEAGKRLGIPKLPYMVFNSPGWEFEAQVFQLFQDYQAAQRKAEAKKTKKGK